MSNNLLKGAEKCVSTNETGLKLSILIILCMVAFSLIFFYNFGKESAMFYSHEYRFDEELLAQIEKQDESSKATTLEEVREELYQQRKLSKYLIERESNYQMEIDLIIDKYSQWTSYWLSIISCVLTVYTLIQAVINYRTNDESAKKGKEAAEHCENVIKDIREEEKKASDNKKAFLEEIKDSNEKIIKDFKLSSSLTKMSSITACISSFPDAFSLTPNEERRRSVSIFMKMLINEYEKLTTYIARLSELGQEEEIDRRLTEQDVKSVYVVWCDISVAVNQIMFDYAETEQMVAFTEVRDILTSNIMAMHQSEINSGNVNVWMRRLQRPLADLSDLLLK